ncbi:MAG TPA: hypothetical protein VNG33_04195, partial [Polyangiaceae bacterium]|nr:hypothetical protein [Polyangiaceae bacterium]
MNRFRYWAIGALAVASACSDAHKPAGTLASAAGAAGDADAASSAGRGTDAAGAAPTAGGDAASGGAAANAGAAAGAGGEQLGLAGATNGGADAGPSRVDTPLELGFSVDAQAYARALAIDAEDNVFIVGDGKNADSLGAWWLKKLDAKGQEDTTHWNKEIVSNDSPSVLATDASGDVFVSGTTTGGWWLKRFDALGVEETTHWNKHIDAKFLTDAGLDLIGVSDAPQRMAVDSQGSVYLVGGARMPVKLDQPRDVWLVLKLGADGKLAWARAFDGGHGWPGADWPYNASAHALAFDSQDNVYVVGEIKETGWWLKKLSSAGVDDTLGWNQHFDLGQGAAARSIAVDAQDHIYVRGSQRTYVNLQVADLPWPCRRFGVGGQEDTGSKRDSGRAPGIAINEQGELYLPSTTDQTDTLALEKLDAHGANLATLLI